MSVQTEIDRIAGNVAAALTACADKGADVPSGSTSDDLAAIIAAIEAGGGGAAFGSFTVADITSNIEVTHGLGTPPRLFAVMPADNSNSAYSTSKPDVLPLLVGAKYDLSGTDRIGIRYAVAGNNATVMKSATVETMATGTSSAAYYLNVTDSTFIFKQQSFSSTYGWGLGQMFYWVAVGEV